MQDLGNNLPFFLNTDNAYEKLKPEESPYYKGLSFDINGNPEQGIGTNNPTGEGQNMFVLTPMRSNEAIPDVLLPVGYNKNIGSFESKTTQELYSFNYNSNSNHGIYVLDGNTGFWQKVLIDPYLQFSDNQEAFIADHRCTLRFVKDKNGVISEKHLLITNGDSWQKWINVIAAIGSDGFNAGIYPYWRLTPPHFDRRELMEWAVRPPMYKPLAKTIPNTDDDASKLNYLVDRAFQFAVSDIYTDGRPTTTSPYSDSVIIATTAYLFNPQNLPKNIEITMAAGSPMTEKRVIYVRQAPLQDGAGSEIAPQWGDWYIYDIINKFSEPASGNYWLRTNAWIDYDYDINLNTIKYIFDNSKAGQIVDQSQVNRLQNDLPQQSVALCDVGDAGLLCNNRYDYDNFTKSILSKLNAEVVEKENSTCNIPQRRIRLYAYVGEEQSNDLYLSQVGYYMGEDKQTRFGGLYIDPISAIFNQEAKILVDESKFYSLDFADRDAFRCYLKGTPYAADGKWYQVKADNSLTPIGSIYDFSSKDTLQSVFQFLTNGGYYICVFDFLVPAGQYIATLGRHNVSTNGDYRNTSTYIYGLADSTIKSNTTLIFDFEVTSLKENAIISYSKEMEINCINGDVDVWGNGQDLFYVYCPWNRNQEDFRFIEGYFYEAPDNKIPVEMFPYQSDKASYDAGGKITDKNGFYWLADMSTGTSSTDIKFVAKLNCNYPNNFTIPTSQRGIGWKVNRDAYLSENNGGIVGDCNRILYRGKITNLDGSIGYSNISVTIKDGMTATTNENGEFTLIIHNGQNVLRSSQVIVNASGNFIITVADCGYVPPFNFNESLVPCVNCDERIYPIPINLAIQVKDYSDTSLKEGGIYSLGCYGMDLAGRMMYVNEFKNIPIPSFLERDNTLATFFRVLINSFDISDYADMKWLAFTVSRNLSQKRYVQWVGDKIQFIDSNGNVVTDPSNATFCAIFIQSLYNYNISNNFSVLATYQFVKGDRVKILDNGEGELFDTATYGDPMDIQILGTNYNQAAINAGLVPPLTNTVFNTTAAQTDLNTQVTLIVRYDSRLNKLIDKEGFWIDIYTPTQSTDLFPYNEVVVYPIINGAIAEFTGYSLGNPTYNFPTQIDLSYWDTYLISRSINVPDKGNISFGHPFESPNVNDSFGANLASGGRLWIKNENAQQRWYIDDTIKSDDFVKEGLINGLGTFKSENRKSFRGFNWGGIVMAHSERSVIFFLCENDWFITNFNFHYTYPNEEGVMITNLDNGISEPMQKIGSNYGCSYEDTGSIIIDNDAVYWVDIKNTSFVEMDYKGARDISQNFDGGQYQKSYRGGMQSYLNSKLYEISKWNNEHEKKDRWDIICGIDYERGNIYVTFRPRRNNSNELYTYISDQRNINLMQPETMIYNIQYSAWIGFAPFAAESYGRVRGRWANVEFISFAAGKPYRHNNSSNESYCNYYGVQTTPVLISVFNQNPAINKILENISLDANNICYFIDLLYSDNPNSFSYLPLNLFKKKENQFYAATLRDMNSYPSMDMQESFRSMLFDGKRVMGRYFVGRFVFDPNKIGQYSELKGIYYLIANSPVAKK